MPPSTEPSTNVPTVYTPSRSVMVRSATAPGKERSGALTTGVLMTAHRRVADAA